MWAYKVQTFELRVKYIMSKIYADFCNLFEGLSALKRERHISCLRFCGIAGDGGARMKGTFCLY